MAYKQQSAIPIVEGGTNTQAMANAEGVIYFDGTELATTGAGTANQILTSNGGGGSAPTFQSAGGGGGSHANFFGTSGPAIVLNSSAQVVWTMPQGNNQTFTTQNIPQYIIPAACTISNMYVYVIANSSSSNDTFTLNVNSVNSTLKVTTTAGMTGSFSDLTHSVSVNAGDIIQFEMSATSGGSVTGLISAQYLL